jgi:hypothetical protein
MPPAEAGQEDEDETEEEYTGPSPGAGPADLAPRGSNFRLSGDRALARSWRARGEANLNAIRLAREIEEAGRPPTPYEQEWLLCFTGFGASDLAQNAFPLPGAIGFREGWEDLGSELAGLVPAEDYALLRRATQYAHYTPEPIGRALWATALQLGFRGGRVLEPGSGTGLLFALLPDALLGRCRLTGIEMCPVTARIARLVHPEARIRCEDYTRSRLGGGFDLAIGNPPFSRRIVRPGPGAALPPLSLHDHFIAASVARLRPGGIALFVTSTGTLDKPDPKGRECIASIADLLGAVRLPEGSFRATAGTEVVVDLLALQRRAEDARPAGEAWTLLTPVPVEATEAGAPASWPVNEYFAAHPEMVLGRHAMRRGVYGPGLSYIVAGDLGPALEARLAVALARLPADVFTPTAEETPEPEEVAVAVGTAAEGATIKEGSYLLGPDGALCQIVAGAPVAVPLRGARGGDGLPPRDADVIRALLPIRDAVREVLRAQAEDRPWAAAQARLRTAYGTFSRRFGPINRTEVTVRTDRETGEEREIHRRPNLAPFADDPDCWLVASIEDYDPDTNLARMGAIFRSRVVAPPPEPVVTGAADGLGHAARALFSTALVRMRPEKDRSLYRLLDFMLTGSREEKEQFFAGTEAAKYFAEKADRAGASVDMNLATFLRALRFLPADSGGDQDFSVTRFMQQVDEHRQPDERLPWIFLTSSQRDHEALRPLLTCWVDSAVSGLMGLGPRPERRVWFFLDELFSLHEVPMLPRALAEGRKFGLAGVIGLQDTGQLNAIYGRDKARSMLSLLNTKALFRVGDSESAKWVSDLIGQAERERAEEAARYGMLDTAAGLNLSTRRGLEALVLGAEVTRLRDLECLLTLPGSWPVARIKIPRTSNAERPRIADAHKVAETATTVAAKLNAKARPSAPATDGDNKAEETSLSAAGILPGLHDTPAMRARLLEVQTARKAGQKVPPLHKDAIGGYAGLKPTSPTPPADAAPQPETPVSPAPAAHSDTAAHGAAAIAGSGPAVADTNATLTAPTAAPAAPPRPQPLLSAFSDPRFGF